MILDPLAPRPVRKPRPDSRPGPSWPISALGGLAMRSDLRALLDCDAIYMLPGWSRSRGARLEARVARACGLRIFRVVGQ